MVKEFTYLRHEVDLLFRRLSKDNTSGSAQIAFNAVKLIKTIIRRADAEASARFFKLISKQLVSAQPSMGIILNLAYSIDEMAGTVTRKDILSYLDNFKTTIETHTKIIAERTSALLESSKTVMTYSASSTVLESLRHAYKNGLRFSVVVPESRPMNEGRGMMVKLSRASIPVLYMTDAAGMSMLASGDIDTVLIGGDAIQRNDFVCKTGSLAIATLCKTERVPLFGLCGTEKIIPEQFSKKFIIANKPAKEVSDFKSRFVQITNRYFEIVPFSMFTKIITDG